MRAHFDATGNPCTTGGLHPTGRLQLIKKDMGDQTLLMPNNHFVTVDDAKDGTYAIKIGIKMPATVKLTVNMDKNMPGGAGELPPVTLNFVEPTSLDVDHAKDRATSSTTKARSPQEGKRPSQQEEVLAEVAAGHMVEEKVEEIIGVDPATQE